MSSSLSLAEATSITTAAIAKADDLGVAMNVAVVDAGGNLTSFTRMDGAWLGSIQIAQDKAFTARAFDMATADLAPMAQPGAPLYGIEVTNRGRVIVFPGGIPVTTGDTVVGAIGVSGGTPDQDAEVAQAGVSAFVAG